MSNLSKEEALSIKRELKEMEKDHIDYSIYRNSKIHFRRKMIDRAYLLTYWKRIKRQGELLALFKDTIDADAKRKKYMDENGKLIYLDD